MAIVLTVVDKWKDYSRSLEVTNVKQCSHIW